MVSTPSFEVLGIDVAQRDAAAVVDALQVLQQIASPAAGADHAELHLIVRGPHLLDRGRALYGGSRRLPPSPLRRLSADRGGRDLDPVP